MLAVAALLLKLALDLLQLLLDRLRPSRAVLFHHSHSGRQRIIGGRRTFSFSLRFAQQLLLPRQLMLELLHLLLQPRDFDQRLAVAPGRGLAVCAS
jgi:hypothetical protein